MGPYGPHALGWGLGEGLPHCLGVDRCGEGAGDGPAFRDGDGEGEGDDIGVLGQE